MKQSYTEEVLRNALQTGTATFGGNKSHCWDRSHCEMSLNEAVQPPYNLMA